MRILKRVGKSAAVKAGAGVDYGGLKGASGMTCMAFAFLWLMVYHKVSQKDFSAMITCAALVQRLFFCGMRSSITVGQGLESRGPL